MESFSKPCLRHRHQLTKLTPSSANTNRNHTIKANTLIRGDTTTSGTTTTLNHPTTPPTILFLKLAVMGTGMTSKTKNSSNSSNNNNNNNNTNITNTNHSTRTTNITSSPNIHINLTMLAKAPIAIVPHTPSLLGIRTSPTMRRMSLLQRQHRTGGKTQSPSITASRRTVTAQ
mmetsp:Transcript_44527/g.96027  ORF Transcript_44527/g.96027 Transcript_44527/m.96027 type:complete len:173 (-) Transcript_44527:784-1302(-)